MKKLLLSALLIATVVSVSAFADRAMTAFNIAGAKLSDLELQGISGRLIVLGLHISDEVKEFDYGQTPYDPDQVHCDIIAHNQAAALGLDTRDQSGDFGDYNQMTVAEIYEAYPNNRSPIPPEGTSGYYFTSSGTGKDHMGTYTRKLGSAYYTRHMNRSFANTEQSITVPIDYRPPGVVSQVFVPLPKMPYFKRYHR